MNDVLAYTIGKACAVSGIGRTRLYALIAAGRIEARSCGRRTLITAESLRAYLESLPRASVRSSRSEPASA